jgi:hypothetical protein
MVFGLLMLAGNYDNDGRSQEPLRIMELDRMKNNIYFRPS